MRNKVFFGILLIIFCVVQLWFMSITFKTPIQGIVVEFNELNQTEVSMLYENNNAIQNGLRLNDIILTIDGMPAEDYFTVKKWRTIEQANGIEYLRDGKTYSMNFKNTQSSPIFDFFPLVGEVISFALAFLLYRNLKKSRSALYLSMLFVIIGFIFMCLGASSRGDALGKIIIGTLVTVLPILFLHFLIVFLKEKTGISFSTKLFKFMYISVAILCLPKLLFFSDSAYIYPVYSSILNINIFIMIVGILASLAYLVYIYYKFRKSESYILSIIKTVFWSLIISFSPIISLSMLPLMLFGHEWANSFVTGWFVLFFPLTFAYLILTKKLYDVDLIIRRILFTILLALIPSLLITFILSYVIHPESSGNQFLYSFMVTLTIMSVILYWLEYITNKIEKIMFPRRYYLHIGLNKVAKDLRSITQFGQLKDIILKDIATILHAEGAALVLIYSDNSEFILEGTMDKEIVEKELAVPDADKQYFQLEVTKHEDYTCYLVIGHKKNGTFISKEEQDWLRLITTYLAVSLENIYLIRKLSVKLEQLAGQLPNEQSARDFVWFRKLMFELQEKERIRIANDLHDTTMQDLFFLKRKLGAIRDSFASGNETYQELDKQVEYVETINMSLRYSCFELHPHLLNEIGLIGTINKLVKEEQLHSDYEIHFYSNDTDKIEAWPQETHRHLFRVVQELLTNAKKHSEAKHVYLALGIERNFFYLHYEDDGVGVDLKQPLDTSVSGMGLNQLRSRVYYLNGQFTMQSEKGKGVQISIQIPISEEMTA